MGHMSDFDVDLFPDPENRAVVAWLVIEIKSFMLAV